MDGLIQALLIRHGESTANAGAPTADPAGIPLTAKGEAQAVHIAAALPGPPALIVSSGFLRAQQTAQPTRERFPEVPHEQWPVEEFTYLVGAVGAATTTADERRPMVRAYWQRADPRHADGPGSESFAGLLDRAGEFLRRLRQCRRGPVAVFTHGYFIRAVLWRLTTGTQAPDSAGMRHFRAFANAIDLPNAAIFPLALDGAGGGRLQLGGLGHLPAELVTGEPPVTHP